MALSFLAPARILYHRISAATILLGEYSGV
jgi:hypothetical protein